MAYKSPNLLAAEKIVERIGQTVQNRAKPGGPSHAAYNHAQRIAASLASLEELVQSASPTETREAHTLRVATAAKRLADNLKQVSERLNTNTNDTYRNLALKIDAAAGLNVESPFSSEIRNHLRSLPDDQRVGFVNDAIKARDTVTLSAILNGPSYLSGLTKDMQSRYSEMYKQEVAPDLVAELEAFVEVDSEAQVVLNLARKTVEAAYDPKYVADILQKADEAKAAQDRLETSMTAIHTPLTSDL